MADGKCVKVDNPYNEEPLALVNKHSTLKFPEQFRFNHPDPRYQSKAGDTYGMFLVTPHGLRPMKVIAIDGAETGWDHVSVSLPGWPNKCPSWEEMCLIKGLFWDDSECVVQFHPPKADNISIHEVLHLWKKVDGTFPMPPKECV